MSKANEEGKAATAEIEAKLWSQYAVGRNLPIRHQLIDHYMPFARILAAKLFAGRQVRQVEFDDFMHYGMVGLIESVDRFDPKRSVDFKTFAGHRIQGAILNGIEKTSEQQQQISLKSRLRRERIHSLAEGGNKKSVKKRDQFLELMEVAVGLALGYILEGSGMYQSTDAGQTDDNLYSRREMQELQRILGLIVKALPVQERTVINYHYFQHLGVEEIGSILGVTKGRVSQIHHSALRLLKEAYLQTTKLNLKL